MPSGRGEIWFVTENRHKFLEARAVVSGFGISLRQLRKDKIEIQSGDLSEIAQFAAEQVSRKQDCSIVVEDSGLFIEALHGFPGPFSSYVCSTIGAEGILRLIAGARKRKAYFQASLALSRSKNRTRIFTGRVHGRIGFKERGSRGFGFDPIFIPEGSNMTFSEMGTESKNNYSHRAVAFRRLAKWYLSSGLMTSSRG